MICMELLNCAAQAFSWQEPNMSNATDYDVHILYCGDYLVLIIF